MYLFPYSRIFDVCFFSFLGAGILETPAELQPCFSCKNFCQDISTLLLSHMLSSSISCLTFRLSTTFYFSLDYKNINKYFFYRLHNNKLLTLESYYLHFLLACYTKDLFYTVEPISIISLTKCSYVLF